MAGVGRPASVPVPCENVKRPPRGRARCAATRRDGNRPSAVMGREVPCPFHVKRPPRGRARCAATQRHGSRPSPWCDAEGSVRSGAPPARGMCVWLARGDRRASRLRSGQRAAEGLGSLAKRLAIPRPAPARFADDATLARGSGDAGYADARERENDPDDRNPPRRTKAREVRNAHPNILPRCVHAYAAGPRPVEGSGELVRIVRPAGWP